MDQCDVESGPCACGAWHTSNQPEFKKFPKIPRLSKPVIVTEKLDGTNAAIQIQADGNIWAQSRNRFITPAQDNYGFATWVHENRKLLARLGPGIHYGEWWGEGIQRRYNADQKYFSLFNTHRFCDVEITSRGLWNIGVRVVPELWEGPATELNINWIMNKLKYQGSVASPGFMDPEGIIVFHTASGALYKHTFENPEGKWK